MTSNSGADLQRSADDPEAFALFYDRHFRDLLSYLTRRIGDVDAGFDLTAEAFAQAFLSRRRFRGSTEEEAAAWLFTIGRRQLSHYLKKGEANRRAMDRLKLERPELQDVHRVEIADLAGIGEIRGALAEGLQDLSPDNQEALRLRVLEELPFSEVARRLDISETAARKRVSRAINGLAATIEQRPPKEAST